MYEPKAWVYQAVLVLLSLVCFWPPLHVGAQNGITHPVEVRALRQIKRALVDPNRNLSNWNRGDPCTSNWNGVLCYNRTLEDGYLHVRGLQVLNMNLSGTLSPQLGRLSRMKILDFMWNELTGSIPPEIGNITSLKLLLLNGNKLSGSLPDELGRLSNLDRIQIDQNEIFGPIPKSFANLTMAKHFHMNDNSISGEIPHELSKLPNLVHFLLDNNNLSGRLPPEFSELPQLHILQLDNNHFDGSEIPDSYSNMTKLLKLSLRNCGLQGRIPNLSRISKLGYLDLSSNQLSGSIPADTISDEITTIDLSNNNLTGEIPASFSRLPRLQKLSLANNLLNGSVSSSIWEDRTLNSTETLELKFQNNRFANISGSSADIPQNVSVWLQGNPICRDPTRAQLCRPESADINNGTTPGNSTLHCRAASCPLPFEYSRTSPVDCFCAAPLIVHYRLKSPGFSDFIPYINEFKGYLSSGIRLHPYQLDIVNFAWVKGPRLQMSLKLFPVFVKNSSHTFNDPEVRRIMGLFTGWNIGDSDVFGPYELLEFQLLGPYAKGIVYISQKSGVSTGALVGIVLGAVAAATTLSAIVTLLIMRKRMKGFQALSRKRPSSKTSLKIDGVKDFTFREMASATNNFDSSTQVGQGGYGKVYKGILADGTAVAIKRAQGGSLQGEREFLTEIQLLSRLHHRNLVSLLGYCDEECEQMLVYEFMSNGSLRDHLSGDMTAKSKEPLSFASRLKIALASAKGILYLHTEANPPIFHRDVKSSNILLDSKFIAKVSDFGLSRLAPVPQIEGDLPNYVSTVVKGTPGYLDPEYFLTHKLTDKSDVYSLGVVFLEILTGMHPIMHGKNIVREVNTAFQSGMIFSVIDARMGSYPSDCIQKFVTLALSCCQDDTDLRPSMAEVVRQLENIWVMMPESEPGSTESSVTPKSKASVTPPSSSEMRNLFWSADVSGSNLDSGVIPTIVPR